MGAGTLSGRVLERVPGKPGESPKKTQRLCLILLWFSKRDIQPKQHRDQRRVNQRLRGLQ